MANAVAADRRTWRGTAPVSPEDGPSEPRQHELPEPTAPMFRRVTDPAVEDTVSPPRSTHARERATDLARATISIPQMAWLIGIAIGIAAVGWRLESRLDLINERIQHNRELIDLREKALEDRFKMLEAKIESAGLRNYNMSVVQELQKTQEALKRQNDRR